MKQNVSSVKFYTVDERIRRVWDAEQIKALISRRSFYLANDMRREELNQLWVTEPEHQKTASLGSNWGYYVGMEAISNYYVVLFDQKRKQQLAAYHKKHPEVEESLENLGYGCMVCHPMSTPLVVISGDGETAKGMWYSIGHDDIAADGDAAECRWSNDKLAVDFIRENGEWKIWHLVIANDLNLPVGGNAEDLPTVPEPGTVVPENEFLEGNPTIKMRTHNGSMNWSDRYPPTPEEYFHFTDEVSYGPEGHPNYNGKSEV